MMASKVMDLESTVADLQGKLEEKDKGNKALQDQLEPKNKDHDKLRAEHADFARSLLYLNGMNKGSESSNPLRFRMLRVCLLFF